MRTRPRRGLPLAFGYAGSLVLVLGVAASSPALVGSLNEATSRATVSAAEDTRPPTEEPSERDRAAEAPTADPLSRGSAGAAQALDLPLGQVDAALRSGADLGALADERGVDRHVLAAAIVSSATEQINAQVTAGGLTRDRADQLIAQLPQQVETALGVATPPQTAQSHPAPGSGLRAGQPDPSGPVAPPPAATPPPAQTQPPVSPGQDVETSSSAPQLPGEQQKGPGPAAPWGHRPAPRSQPGGHAAASSVQSASSSSEGSPSSGPDEGDPEGAASR